MPPRLLRTASRLRTEYREMAPAVGSLAAAHFVATYVRRRLFPSRSAFRVRSRDARFPLVCREGASDFDTFKQVFVERSYACVADLPNVDVIVDCGANVGYAAAFLLTAYPAARLLAVEPEPANLDILRQNLAPYGPRARALQAGLWPHRASLSLVTERYRDGRDWSRQVTEAASGPGSIPGLDLPALLDELGADRVSLLKIDIEGAEAVVFRDRPQWLDRVDTIAIELHADSAFGDGPGVFAAATAGRFDVSQHGDVTVARRRATRRP